MMRLPRITCVCVLSAAAPGATAQTWDNEPPPGPVESVGVCHLYAADAGPGGTFFLETGTYVLEDPLTVPIGAPLFDLQGDHIRIDCQGHTITTQPGSGPVVASSLPDDADWFSFNSAEIDNAATTTTPAIDLAAGDYITIVDVGFDGWDGPFCIVIDDFGEVGECDGTDIEGDFITAGDDVCICDCTARNVGGFAVVGDRGSSRKNHVTNTTGTVITAGDSFQDCDSKYAEFGEGYNCGCGVFLTSLTACDVEDPPPSGPHVTAGPGLRMDSVTLVTDSVTVLNAGVLEVVQIGFNAPNENKPSTIINSDIRTVPRAGGTAPSAVASRTPLEITNTTMSVTPDQAASVTHDPLVFMDQGAGVTMTNCTILSRAQGAAVVGSTVRASGCTFQTDQTGFSAVAGTVVGSFRGCDIRVGRRFEPAGTLPAPTFTQIALRGSNIEVYDCSLSAREDDGTALDLLGGSSVTGCSIDGRVNIGGSGTRFTSNTCSVRGPLGLSVQGTSHIVSENIFWVVLFFQAIILTDFNGGLHRIENNTFSGSSTTTCIDLTGTTGAQVSANSAGFEGGVGTFINAGGNPNVISPIVTNTVPASTDYRPNVVTSN